MIETNSAKLAFVGFVAVIAASVVAAQQTVISDYEEARDDFFWAQLYADGGETLYCGIPLAHNTNLTVEHVYAAQWMAEAVGCATRNECDVELFHHAEADLHNLWPAMSSINSSRGDQLFGEILGEDGRRFESFCPDYERTTGADAIVEPRDSVKGDIARSILYMAIYYDFPLFGMGSMLIAWHREDPVDQHERARNAQIELLQGTSNPFVDKF